MEQVWVARVAVAAATYAIDKPYDYLISKSMKPYIMPGMRVTIPFSRSNRLSEGIVLSVVQGSKYSGLKTVSKLLDDKSILDNSQIKLALWLRERYFCTIYEAIKTMLPAGLWYKVREVCTLSVDRETALEAGTNEKECRVLEALAAHDGSAELETLRLACGETAAAVVRELQRRGVVSIDVSAAKKISDKQVRQVTLAVSAEEAMAAVDSKRNSAPMRYEVIKLLCTNGSALSSDICYFTGCSTRTLKSLEASGLVYFSQVEVLRVPKVDPADGVPIVLNEEQQAAYDMLAAQLDTGKSSCNLLYGVTGSGKTAVYIRLLQEVVRRGKQGMILVPEIALTPQMMAKFSAYFGDRVVMLHSKLRMSERYDQWKRIRRGEVDIVLGTRSAVFAPLKNLGMIILDEEHEGSYRSENSPRYHARDVAKYLCWQQEAVLVLGSATPSVESTFQAQKGMYQKLILRSRFNHRPLPRVVIADMRLEIRAGNGGMISAPLREELEVNLSRGEQSILFLNRRGNSRMLLCGECGEVPQCPRCSVPLTFHSANGRLMCHYCGYSDVVMRHCPECGGLMKQVGAGTQKVEEELKDLFPAASVLRMDADTVSGNHEAMLERFERERISILLGTQMVAKGLDFENVTLVGVLAADLGLYMDNYHAAERTFSLLTQVVGRAGRGSKDGRAVIQTFSPDNEVITSAAAQDYNSFYAAELRLRRGHQYPPFADIFTLTVTGREESFVVRAAAQLKEAMRAGLRYPTAANLSVDILGPAPAPVVKVNNRYRYRLFWVGRNDHATREMLGYYIRSFYQKPENRGMNLFVDCNAED